MKVHPNNKIVCPNCNTACTGNYCPQCGQATHIHQETFWHMVLHFAGHYFHFESKLWKTIRLLIIKPGQLTLSWQQKQRARYVEPINLYMFVSVIFFIIVSFTVRFEQKTTMFVNKTGDKDGEIEYAYAFGRTDFKDIYRLEDHKWVTEENWDELKERVDVIKDAKKEYNLKGLPKDLMDFVRYPIHENFAFIFYNYFVFPYAYNHKIENWDEGVTRVVEAFLHLIPKMFFLFMPLFALLLSMFFRKKGNRFLDHGVLSLHAHIFFFLCGIIQLTVGSVIHFSGGLWLFLFYIMFPYLHLTFAIHNFYKINWLRAIITSTISWGSYIVLVFSLSIAVLLWLTLYS